MRIEIVLENYKGAAQGIKDMDGGYQSQPLCCVHLGVISTLWLCNSDSTFMTAEWSQKQLRSL